MQLLAPGCRYRFKLSIKLLKLKPLSHQNSNFSIYYINIANPPFWRGGFFHVFLYASLVKQTNCGDHIYHLYITQINGNFTFILYDILN